MNNNTTNLNFSELILQLRSIMETGSEEEARRFLMEHLNELPQSVKDGVIASLFEEALTKTTQESQTLNAVQEGALEELMSLKKQKIGLEDKVKLQKIKDSF